MKYTIVSKLYQALKSDALRSRYSLFRGMLPVSEDYGVPKQVKGECFPENLVVISEILTDW